MSSSPIFFLLLFALAACAPSVPYKAPYIPAPSVPIYEPQKPPPAPVKKRLIVVDPGHGGEDDGTKSLVKPFYKEKFLTLSTARFLRDYLKQMGYEVQMTRNEDVFIPLSTRALKANEVNPSLFVSVHYNSAPSPEAHGIEVFFYQSEEGKERTKQSRELAAIVLDEVVQLTQAKSRGVKKGNFAVIRETKMPAILVEGGFLTNQDEVTKIKDPNYLKKLAWGIAKGIDKFLNRTSSDPSYSAKS